MQKKKIPWTEITAVCSFLLLLITIIVFQDKLSTFFRSLGGIYTKIYDVFLLILSLKVPIYVLLLLVIFFFMIRIIIKRIKRKSFVYIRDCVLHQIFQLEEIGEKSLRYEYIEILKSGFGYKINNEVLPEEKETEFQDIIADLFKNKLIISEAETKDKGKLYKMSEKGRKYAKKKRWKVL